ILPEVLEATGRIREGRGALGTQVAVSIQSDRPVDLARTNLRKGRIDGSVVARGTRLPGSLGHRAVPIPLPITRLPVVPDPRSRVVPDGRALVGDVPPEPGLGRLDHLRAGTARRRCAADHTGLDQRGPGEVRRGQAGATVVARRVAARRRAPPSYAADGPPCGPDPGLPHPVAPAG